MLGVHKSISLPQSTEYSKEMAKWESFPSQWGAPGRPYQFREFPKRVYKCAQETGKGIAVSESFTVNNEDEERNLLSRGFSSSLQAAHDAVLQAHTEHGKLAAEREYEIRHGRLSEGAVAEVRAAEADYGSRHLPTIPETPIKRKGWPKGKPRAKAAPAPVTA